jgi:glutamine amidotransferase
MHDLVVRDLERASNRTLGLTDLDDPPRGPDPHDQSACDSVQLAAYLFDLGPEGAGEFIRDLGKRDPDARPNLLLTGGRPVIATRWNDTLSILRTRGGGAVASNPLTTPRAGPTSPDHHLVDMADGVVTGTDQEA